MLPDSFALCVTQPHFRSSAPNVVGGKGDPSHLEEASGVAQWECQGRGYLMGWITWQPESYN